MIIAGVFILLLGCVDSWFISDRSKKHVVISAIVKVFAVLLFAVGISDYTTVFNDVAKVYLLCSTMLWLFLMVSGVMLDARNL